MASVNLHIRPEDLTRPHPSRVTVHQTLGGAWADYWGEGVGTINISGHTGWGQGAAPDGFERFQVLYSAVWKEFHRRREAAADPESVELLFEDQLNDYAVKVEPQNFMLRRHKRQPLLHSYQISMHVIGDAGVPGNLKPDPYATALGNRTARHETSADELAANVQRQGALAEQLTPTTVGGVADSLKGLVTLSNDLLTRVTAIAAKGVNAFDEAVLPILTLAADLERAARNAYNVLVTPIEAAEEVKATLSRIASNFNTAYCLLVNGIDALREYDFFDGILGSSTCSSTLGAGSRSPYTDVNTFEQILAAAEPVVSVDDPARNALVQLNRDPLSLPQNVSSIIAEIDAINAGVAFR